MNETLARAIDRYFIAFVLKKRRSFIDAGPNDGQNARPEEYSRGRQFTCSPDEIPRLKLLLRSMTKCGKQGCVQELCFASPFNTPWPENNILYAEHFQSRIANSAHLVILHGYQDSKNIFQKWLGGSLLKIGISSLVLELPYHMRRAPHGTFSGEYFSYRGVEGTLQSIRQAVSEVCAIVTWLKGHGQGKVGVFGSSLGGLIAALASVAGPEIDFCILNVPVLDLADLTRRSPAAKPFRMALDGVGEAAMLKFKALADSLMPGSFKPRLSKDDILVFEALYDGFVPSGQVEALKKSWGAFRVRKLPQGHISAFIFARSAILKETANFVFSR